MKEFLERVRYKTIVLEEDERGRAAGQVIEIIVMKVVSKIVMMMMMKLIVLLVIEVHQKIVSGLG